LRVATALANVADARSTSRAGKPGGRISATDDHEVTALLADLGRGNRTAMEALMPLVYDQLRLIARRYLSDQDAGHTLNPTALVHESYLKLVRQPSRTWQDRAHFLSVAAVAMRHILVNHARDRRAAKRDGGQIAVTLDEGLVGGQALRSDELLALDDALARLDGVSPRQRSVVEYRFFGGLTHEEIAEVLGVSVPTVRRDWRIARAWLVRELTNHEEEAP
jgi:RNA polymerase sigma factor (TIGR02999 family)